VDRLDLLALVAGLVGEGDLRLEEDVPGLLGVEEVEAADDALVGARLERVRVDGLEGLV
jgi:hypothetical protein